MSRSRKHSNRAKSTRRYQSSAPAVREADFKDVPRRIFLDSSTLQTLQTYGEFIYGGGCVDPEDRIHRDPLGIEKLESLRLLIRISSRGPFAFALSENSILEVRRRHDPRYLRWAHEMLAYWHECQRETPAVPPPVESTLDSPTYGYLGAGDRALLSDALTFGCDTFLTMENRLPKNAEHISRTLRLRVLTPLGMWTLLRPWAALYY